MKLLISFVIFALSSSIFAATEVPGIDAKAYFLIDANTARPLAAKNINDTLDPASITKIMTSYVLFSKLEDGSVKLDDLVDISEAAASKGGSRMFIKAGSQVKLEDLMWGMIVSSGNDASIAIAEYIAGTEEAFADLMNQYADKLALDNSFFLNATGWPENGHYSSAKDIANLSLALIRDFPEYYKIFAERSFTYGKSPKGEDITQANRNGLLWRKGFKADGIKTGHTEAAGYCLAASATRGNMRLISVIMGAKSNNSRVEQSQSLLNYGFRKFITKKLYAKDAVIRKVKVRRGEGKQLIAGSDKDLFVTVERIKQNDLEIDLKIAPDIRAPITKGKRVGDIIAKIDEKVIAEHPLVALETIHEGGMFIRIWDDFLQLINW